MDLTPSPALKAPATWRGALKGRLLALYVEALINWNPWEVISVMMWIREVVDCWSRTSQWKYCRSRARGLFFQGRVERMGFCMRKMASSKRVHKPWEVILCISSSMGTGFSSFWGCFWCSGYLWCLNNSYTLIQSFFVPRNEVFYL